MACDVAGSNTEEWRPVVGFEGWYEVSDHGRVKRVKAARGTQQGYVLRPSADGNGYCQVKLSKNSAKNRSSCYVHHLVCDAFLGPCPVGLERNHIDGNKLNNSSGNLEYVTSAENTRHANRLGRFPKGESNGHAKLTDSDVRLIRSLAGTLTYVEISRVVGVHPTSVSMAARGLTWKHLG